MLALLGIFRKTKARCYSLYENTYVRTLGWSVAGGAVWGTWAYIANFNSPELRLSSAYSQATSSFLFTLIGIVLLEAFYKLLSKLPFRATLSVAAVSLASLATMVSIHMFNGTPNIVITVLPVISVSILFCSFYVSSIQA